MDKLVKLYPKEVRHVFLHNPLPFHKKAMPAAEAAQAVFALKGAEAFFKYHDLVFENQKNLDRSDLEGHAQKMGMDMKKFKQALDKKEHRPAIRKMQAVARRLGASGTPAYFINGRFMNGARPLAAFRKLVNEELGKARKLVKDKKIARDKIYGVIMKTAIKKVN